MANDNSQEPQEQTEDLQQRLEQEQQKAQEYLRRFVKDIYPFLLTFITLANAGSVATEADA